MHIIYKQGGKYRKDHLRKTIQQQKNKISKVKYWNVTGLLCHVQTLGSMMLAFQFL